MSMIFNQPQHEQQFFEINRILHIYEILNANNQSASHPVLSLSETCKTMADTTKIYRHKKLQGAYLIDKTLIECGFTVNDVTDCINSEERNGKIYIRDIINGLEYGYNCLNDCLTDIDNKSIYLFAQKDILQSYKKFEICKRVLCRERESPRFLQGMGHACSPNYNKKICEMEEFM